MAEQVPSWRHRLARLAMQGQWLVVIVLVALLALRYHDPAVVQKLRFLQFDFFQQTEPRADAKTPVVIVDIDDESLNKIGQWPWPRNVLATLVDRLREAGIGIIAFDVTFPEADRAAPGWMFDALEQGSTDFASEMMAGPSNDSIFADAMKKTRVVLGIAHANRLSAKGAPPLTPPPAEIGGDPRPAIPAYAGIVSNLAELDAAAAGRGAFSLFAESDSIVRRVPSLIRVDETIYPALVPEILRVATGEPNIAIRSGEQGIDSIIIQKTRIPTDKNGNIWVRYQERDPSIYVSAADVLAGTVPPEKFAGRGIALVGTSAAGLEDIKATPMGLQVPGVEIHWQLLGSILSNQYLVRLPYADAVELGGVLVIGLIIIFLTVWLRARWTALLLLGLLAASAGGAWYAFSAHGLLFDAVYPAIATVLLYTMQVYVNHHVSERQRRQVSDAFGRYVSPVLVQRLAKESARLELGGETKDMTILFCDIRGFTQISERFKGNPQGLTTLINRFLTPLSEEVMHHQGTIDKYIGDCIMAFWNAPLDDPDHARNACRAALAMFEALDLLNVQLAQEARMIQEPENLPRAYRRLKELGEAERDERLQIAATLRGSASEGHAYAQYTLGKAYRDGLVGQRSADEAVRWFAAAAEQGYSLAQRNLGERLARGDGVARDEVMALQWLTLAARDGLAAAEEVRIELMQRMTVAEIAAAERRARAWRPNSPRLGVTAIHMGIGINSGECVVGNMGSRLRFDYSVLGDAVNVAARVESQSSNYGVDIVITETTYAQAPDFAALEIDRIIVKGKSEPLRIYALLGTPEMAGSAEFRDLAWRHEAMLQAYRERQWQESLQHIETCAHLWPSLAPLYDLYRDRIENFLIDPPSADWDGVFVALKK